MVAESGNTGSSRRAVMKRFRLQGGSNLVEFALVLPLLLVLMFGIIDFGLALFDKAVITNAAREGARAGMVFAETRRTDAEIEAVVQNYCSDYLVTFGAGTPAVSVARTGTGSGDSLTVTVTYSYDYVVMSKLVPGLGTLNMTARSVMRYE
jgi:Flp pilus assembly protein TadG